MQVSHRAEVSSEVFRGRPRCSSPFIFSMRKTTSPPQIDAHESLVCYKNGPRGHRDALSRRSIARSSDTRTRSRDASREHPARRSRTTIEPLRRRLDGLERPLFVSARSRVELSHAASVMPPARSVTGSRACAAPRRVPPTQRSHLAKRFPRRRATFRPRRFPRVTPPPTRPRRTGADAIEPPR
jgi:hypothetical protein